MYNVTDAELENLFLTIKDVLSSAASSATTNKVLVRKRDMMAFFDVDRGMAEGLLSEQINDLLSTSSMCLEFGEWIFVDYGDNGIFIQLNKPGLARYGWAGMMLSNETVVFDFKHLALQRDSSAS